MNEKLYTDEQIKNRKKILSKCFYFKSEQIKKNMEEDKNEIEHKR